MTLIRKFKRSGGFACTTAAGAAAALLMPFFLLGSNASERTHVEPLLATSTTVLGQPIAYAPGGTAKVTSAIVELPPGGKTGLHRHDVPMFAYVLSGEVTVDYQGEGSRTYRAGEALVEAIDTPHDGYNSGAVPTRILTVFFGAEGTPDTELLN